MGRPKNFSREDVLKKSIPLFWKRGFADTGLQDLEKATGVNKSGLYSEFKNKEDLYLASLQYYLENRSGKEILTKHPLGWSNLETFLKMGLDCPAGSKGCFLVNSMRELALLPPKAVDIVAENFSQLKRLVIKNITVEETHTPADAIADVLLTFFSGLSIEENIKSSKTLLSQKVQTFMKAIRSL